MYWTGETRRELEPDVQGRQYNKKLYFVASRDRSVRPAPLSCNKVSANYYSEYFMLLSIIKEHRFEFIKILNNFEYNDDVIKSYGYEAE